MSQPMIGVALHIFASPFVRWLLQQRRHRPQITSTPAAGGCPGPGGDRGPAASPLLNVPPGPRAKPCGQFGGGLVTWLELVPAPRQFIPAAEFRRAVHTAELLDNGGG